MKPVKVLCVGGSDSSGGAGIQADLKAVIACGCYGMSVITAVTVQNTRGVQSIHPVPQKFILAQLDSVLSDIGADAVKTGMLLTVGAVEAVVKKVKEYRLEKLIVDPVMIAKGGHSLMQDKARVALIRKLLPLAFVVTPNIPEAEVLAQCKIETVAGMKKAAALIHGLGVKNVVIKGGHLPGNRKSGSIDILYDGKQYFEFPADWIETKDTHGTGCTYASVLAASLAQGKNILHAVEQAKVMVTRAIENSLHLGKGHGPVHAGIALYPRGKRHECLLELRAASHQLATFRSGRLIPEVQSNLVYAIAGAEDERHVAGFPGRIICLRDKAHAVADPEFGASRHIANIVLTVLRYDPSYRSAMNIKYSEQIIEACRRLGFSVESFARANEPSETKNTEGASLEWGVNEVLKRTKTVPDIIFDKGGWGKEPMVRVLGKNPLDVVNKVQSILRQI